MIKPQEISRIASREGVRPQQIEKDYIISWVLWGVYNHSILKEALIIGDYQKILDKIKNYQHKLIWSNY